MRNTQMMVEDGHQSASQCCYLKIQLKAGEKGKVCQTKKQGSHRRFPATQMCDPGECEHDMAATMEPTYTRRYTARLQGACCNSQPKGGTETAVVVIIRLFSQRLCRAGSHATGPATSDKPNSWKHHQPSGRHIRSLAKLHTVLFSLKILPKYGYFSK